MLNQAPFLPSQQRRHFKRRLASLPNCAQAGIMGKDSRDILVLPCRPQQILASVSEGVQRLQQHLKSHPLGLPLPHEPLHATKIALQKQPVSERTREATSKKSQVLVEDEGVMVAVQVCSPSSYPFNNHLHASLFFYQLMARVCKICDA